MCLVVGDTFEQPFHEQLQSKKRKWDELSNTDQNELAIILSAT